jgi:hypothetical protein
MVFSNSFPASNRHGLSRIARTSTLALSLVAGSLTLWPSPVSAEPVPVVDGSCVALLGGNIYWEFTGFDQVDGGVVEYSTTVEVSGNLVIFVGSMSSEFLEDYGPRIEFYSDSDCEGLPDSQPNSSPPVGIEEVCVASTPGAVSGFEVRLRRLAPTFDPPFDVSTPATPGNAVNFDDVAAAQPARIEVENFTLDPSFTGAVEVQIVLGANFPCEFRDGSDGERPGGFDLDVDIDHYRNRAASETGALPDTL